jgi:hypothetical protein
MRSFSFDVTNGFEVFLRLAYNVSSMKTYQIYNI